MRLRRMSLALGAGVVAAALARAELLHWGATADDLRAVLPGDELIPDASTVATRAVSIGCAAEAVWPWIAQLGQGRAGFYSYDRAENLVGCDIHSADRIVPEWQNVRVGDEVRLHPDVPLKVAVVDAGRALVLRGGVPVGGTEPPFDFTWSFVVLAGSDGGTRLLVRERYRYLRWWTAMLVEPTEVVSFVMSRKMLHGIRDRAEGRAPAQ